MIAPGRLIASLWCLLQTISGAEPFLLPQRTDLQQRSRGPFFRRVLPTLWRFSTEGTSDGSSEKADLASMTVSEIRSELISLGVDFSDCFDKESLLERLKDAREGRVQSTSPSPKSSSAGSGDGASTASGTSANPEARPASPSSDHTSSQISRLSEEELRNELRDMSVKELRTELASRNHRWAGLLEKEDLVQAVLKARVDAGNFSVTGKIEPGVVATLTGNEAMEEIRSNGVSSPLLLDVFAVWCGPCQLMASQLQDAAKVLQDRVRFAKCDSDAYPHLAETLKVQGLPTILLFNGGKEAGRLEGAMMKDEIIRWIESKM